MKPVPATGIGSAARNHDPVPRRAFETQAPLDGGFNRLERFAGGRDAVDFDQLRPVSASFQSPPNRAPGPFAPPFFAVSIKDDIMPNRSEETHHRRYASKLISCLDLQISANGTLLR